MRRLANETAIKRKATLGRFLTYAGFGIMGIGLVISFTQTQYSSFILLFALLGVILSQIGMMMTNRWGRSPRIDEVIDRSLKGLSDQYSVFHYVLGADHVLVCPAGIYTLVTSLLDGEMNYEEGNWWQTRIRRGRPRKKAQKNLDSEVKIEVNSTQKALNKRVKDTEVPDVGAILVFVHPDAAVHSEGVPYPTMHLKKLKSFLRKLDKGPTLTLETVGQLSETLGLI
ncbi:MAG: hypothetical protein GTO18_02870 [Anaerolineales bacterium]|nr:hypothetical protein [Anaerolineales bacterium]